MLIWGERFSLLYKNVNDEEKRFKTLVPGANVVILFFVGHEQWGKIS
jgi:hypothetical protein